MKIIYTFQEALQECKKYVDDSDRRLPKKVNSAFKPPLKFIQSGPWEMSLPALETTLHYLLDYLHHSCYLLCSDGKVSSLIKIEQTTTAPFFKKVIEQELSTLDKNTTLTASQKGSIRQFVKDSNKLRILQCIVKKIKKETTTSNEYERFIRGLSLPMGVYVMNLTDANLLHKDGLEPFPVFRGQAKSLPDEFLAKSFLPIFSLSGNKKFHDIPIPNYDDVSYSLGMASYNIGDFTTEWSQKTIPKAVFRGGPSGCGYTTETNQRLRLTTIRSPDLDVGIVSEKDTIDSNSIRFDPIHGLGMLNTGIQSVGRLNYVEQSRYKYILHIDGNVNAYRLLSILATGSLILRVKSSYTSWADSLLKPGMHYIEIASNLSNLLEKVEWCKQHETECSKIASNGLKVAREILLNPEYVRGAFQKIAMATLSKIPTKIPTPPPKIPTPSPPSSDSSFYIKGENEKKCKMGFVQDKKDKTKCVSKNNNNITKKVVAEKVPKIVVAQKVPKIVVAEKVPKMVVAEKVPKMVVPKMMVVDIPEIYIKGENERKCKTGFVQDKKDKTKCIKTTNKITKKIPLNPVIKAHSVTVKRKLKLPPPEEEELYESGRIRRKCDTIKDKISSILQ
jgi:hypothetical protein